MKEAVIFGAGEWGRIAQEYFKDKYRIVSFVDNNPLLWGKEIKGVAINSPNILANSDAVVIIANSANEKAITSQIFTQYHISQMQTFRIYAEVEEIKPVDDAKDDEIIISFTGGLGNQLFSYALYRYFQKIAKRVSADFSFFFTVSNRNAMTRSVFPNMIDFNNYNQMNRAKYISLAPYLDESSDILFFRESASVYDGKTEAINNLLNTKAMKGFCRGCFQTALIPQLVEAELRNELVFLQPSDKGVEKNLQLIGSRNSVSVHIRRSDYLLYPQSYGNICTEQYYADAISYAKEKIRNPLFCFFSDDIEWVKQRYNIHGALYIESSMFDDYHDWYDMYLMSKCKHNIIANSTFSWWGAWLNANPQKTVIAPKKWIYADKFGEEATEDICPKEWIRM